MNTQTNSEGQNKMTNETENEMITIKKTTIVNDRTNKARLEYGLYDALGFIFSAEKTLSKAIEFCNKNQLEYNIIGECNK